MKRSVYLILFIFIAAFLVVPDTAEGQFLGYRIDKDKKRVRLPFEIYNNLVVIPIRLNGVIPLNFVVDTGVRSSIITEKLVTDILRLPYSRKITVNGPGDYVILEAYVVNMVDIVMEGAVGSDQSILVLEEDYLQLRNYLGTEVHGMIGYDLFNRFVVEMDYSRRVMILHEPKYFTPPRRFKVIDMTVEDTKPYMRANIILNDSTKVNGKFMVDTGASHAIMLNEQSDPRIKVPTKYLKMDIGRGLGGAISGKIGIIDEINFDKFAFEDVIASFPDPEAYPDTLGLVYRNGTIGGELLSRFNVIFDYFRNKIYLKKNVFYKKDFGFNMSGVTVIAEGDQLSTYRVTEIRKNSPAEKIDIRPNDYIIEINGIGTDNLTLNDIYKVFNYKEGKKVRLIISRNGEKVRKNFRLENMLLN